MKKMIFALLMVSAAFGYSCNSDNNALYKRETTDRLQTVEGSQDGKVTAESETNKTGTKTVAQNAETKATAEMCACVNASLKDMSPRVQQVFIRAGNSENALEVLRNEVAAISDKEQEELMVQLQRFSSDPQLQDCSGKILRKYGLDPDDKASQKRVLQAAKNNKDCELVQALIKIGMQQQTNDGK